MLRQLDLLIACLPPSYVNEPPLAPALLKAAVESQGFSCRTVDLSLDCLIHVFDNNYEEFLQWNKIFPEHHDFKHTSELELEYLDQIIDYFIELLEIHQPRFTGLSVFSIWQQRFAYFLCQRIKALSLPTKIVIGGMGCQASPSGLASVIELGYFDQQNSYALWMKKQGLADHVVLNDGEIELVKILQGQSIDSNTAQEVEFAYDYLPNYDDYKLDQYLYANDKKELLVQGSKGCVRHCVFCSEPDGYSKFYFKTGQHIAKEIIALSKKYQVSKFYFTDSLVNGNLKEFKNFTACLAEYNLNNPNNTITWHGNYICRSTDSMTDQDFVNIKQSGGHGLTIGAESGSNSVLKEMNKRISVEDLLYEIDKFDQHKITCTLLFMIGFYNETWQDFLQTLNLLKQLRPYIYNQTVTGVRLGYTLSIANWDHIDSTQFRFTANNKYDWVYDKNPDLTLQERIRRRIIAQEFCDSFDIPVLFAREDLVVLNNLYNNNIDQIAEFEHAHT